jgi:phosphatidylserine/phosphatidylglycerophosphate/cardiolipin synthase-like enzyme
MLQQPRPHLARSAEAVTLACVSFGAVVAGCAAGAVGPAAARGANHSRVGVRVSARQPGDDILARTDGLVPISDGVRGGAAGAGGLSLIVEPTQGLAAIDGDVAAARRSVDVTMYELDDATFEAALVADARRGVRVRVLLNGGYYGRGGFSANDAATSYLRAHGVRVRASPSSFALTHQKTITIDNKASLVMTLNLTSRYYATDRDFAIADTRPADVAAIERVFGADWSDKQISPSAGTGDLVWSPGAQNELLSLIAAAKTSLEVESEEMDDSAITSALCAAASRRVHVRVVMTYDDSWRDAFATLTACGVQVRTYAQDAALYIHAKEIVVDDREAFVGSQNFSPTSLEANRELGIITANPQIVTQLAQTFAADDNGATPYNT